MNRVAVRLEENKTISPGESPLHREETASEPADKGRFGEDGCLIHPQINSARVTQRPLGRGIRQ